MFCGVFVGECSIGILTFVLVVFLVDVVGYQFMGDMSLAWIIQKVITIKIFILNRYNLYYNCVIYVWCLKKILVALRMAVLMFGGELNSLSPEEPRNCSCSPQRWWSRRCIAWRSSWWCEGFLRQILCVGPLILVLDKMLSPSSNPGRSLRLSSSRWR